MAAYPFVLAVASLLLPGCNGFALPASLPRSRRVATLRARAAAVPAMCAGARIEAVADGIEAEAEG